MSVSVDKFYTRASIRESIMSFAARIKQEPAIVVAPEKIIMPVYDPPASANKAPAVGPPIKEGKEITLYNTPIFFPISRTSDICATHGVITEMNDPEKNPYKMEKAITDESERARIHSARQRTPDKNAEGARMLKRPMVSDRMAGAMRPKTPPKFIRARTRYEVSRDMERSWA